MASHALARTRRWWRTTFGLVTLVATAFALATLVIGAVAFEVTHEAMEQQLDHRIAAETKALTDEGEDGPAGVAHAIRRREAARNTASLDYRLVDPRGRTVAGRLQADVPDRPGYVELLPYRGPRGMRIAQSLTTRLPSGHRLLVAADRGVIDEMDFTFIRLFLGAFGAMLALGIAGAWIVGALTRARLARIDTTALAIIEGDLAQRVAVTGAGDEFDRVAATLNRMLDRIATLMDNLRQVSGDVAHDLRTPLTRLHNRLDEALGSDDRAVQRAAIAAAAAQSRELLEIFAALLRIAEVEGLSPQTQFHRLDLSTLVEGIVETYRPDMEARGHRLSARIERCVMLDGDRRQLQQLMTNLLDNALIHTPPGTAVGVVVEQLNDAARINVHDSGPGVAQSERETLFRRFTRGQRSRSTSGHGLGLALVAAIAKAHHGTVEVDISAGFALDIRLRGVG